MKQQEGEQQACKRLIQVVGPSNHPPSYAGGLKSQRKISQDGIKRVGRTRTVAVQRNKLGQPNPEQSVLTVDEVGVPTGGGSSRRPYQDSSKTFSGGKKKTGRQKFVMDLKKKPSQALPKSSGGKSGTRNQSALT